MSITSASICEAADQLQGFVGFNARTGQHIVRFSEDSELVKKSSAVARASPGVRGKARYASSGRLGAIAVGGSFFTSSHS